MRAISVRRPGHAGGVEGLAEREHLLRRGGRPELDAERVADAAQELQVGAVDLARALADPQHVGRAVVPLAGGGVDAGQRLLVAEDERLVARVQVDLVQLVRGLEVDAAGAHEPQRPLDLLGQRLVAPPLAAGGDELLVPGVHAREVGEAALGVRAQQVQRRGRLVVRLDEPRRIGPPCLGRRCRAVHDVAAEHRQVDVADALGGSRPRLRELAGDAPDLDRRARRTSRSARPTSAGSRAAARGSWALRRRRTTRRSHRPGSGTRGPRKRGRAPS